MTHDVSERLDAPAAPNLPLAPNDYERAFQDAVNNVLRLYFNRLDTSLRSAFGPLGGRFFDIPNGLFFDLGSYSIATANTGYPLEFKQTYLSNGITVVDNTKITVQYAGIYNFQYSSAVSSTNASIKTIWVWIVRNGIPIGYSTNAYTLSGAGSQTIIAWNFNIDLDRGEYIELYWGASDTTVTISTVAATPPHTGIPANVVTVNFVSPLPDPRPIPPPPP